MTICPRCGQQHKGPRDLMTLRAEAAHVLVRADAMPMSEAAEYLRTQWLAGSRELERICTDCIVVELAAGKVQVETVAHAEQALEAVTGPHVCLVVGLDAYRMKKRDLLDIDATYDSTRKP